MTTKPPLLKPRHADGRLMTKDEIRELNGNMLRQLVGVCVMGARWRWWNGDGHWFLELREAVENLDGLDRPYFNRPSFLHPQDDKPVSFAQVPDWTNDITAAFTVNRPEWLWTVSERPTYLELTIWFDNGEPDDDRVRSSTLKVYHVVNTVEKPRPQDHAKGHCIAALLLAAQDGE